MTDRKLEDYLDKPAKQLLPLIAFKVDNIEERLDVMNGTVSDHEKRIMESELRRDLEKEYGLIKLPMNKKKLVAVGGGSVAFIAAVIYLIPIIVDLIRGAL
ncbi:hypothetical protein LCGC14_1705930 [marine sediment metagenome]|uniref:Uncharacterized protein n=1 Tax=marine sediment metagenome TaxID=412755 RepID=A0A0F9I494_9ZZZZ